MERNTRWLMKEKGSFLLSVSWCPKRVIHEKSKTQICPRVGKDPKLIQSAQFYNTKLKSLWLGAGVRCRWTKFIEDAFTIKKKIYKTHEHTNHYIEKLNAKEQATPTSRRTIKMCLK